MSATPTPAVAEGAAKTSFESLPDFVKRTKQAALDHLAGKTPGSKALLIMGNTAGDLDSASSAIGLSYLLTHFPQVYNLDLAPGTLIAPLLQSSPSDGALRPENVAALALSELPLTLPLHNEELLGGNGSKLALDASVELSPARGTLLGLVDHASLGSSWRSSEATPSAEAERKVVLVVDHHVDEGAHLDAKLRVLQGPGWKQDALPAGSASSIVADLFARQLKEAQGMQQEEGVRQVADLLLSAILIDTDNVRAAPRGKAAPIDQSSLALLLPLSSFSNPSSAAAALSHALLLAPTEVRLQPPTLLPQADVDSLGGATTGAYWGVLIACKTAVGSLSTRDLLRRDYKESLIETSSPSALGPKIRVGFSSVPMGLATWLARDGEAVEKDQKSRAWEAWWSALRAWMEERELDGAVVGTSFREEKEGEMKHRRETIIAFTTHALPPSRLAPFFNSVRTYLEADAYSPDPSDPNRLMLEQPWKGRRLPSGGRERVGGIDDDGKLMRLAQANERVAYAAVYKQANAKASRKQVLPAVVAAVKAALEKA